MLGAGLTTTGVDFAFVESDAEVAVTVTFILDVTDAGALYVAAVAVVLLKVPQADPLQPVPDMLQLTPLLLESLVTVAVKATVCPWSMVA